MENLKRKRNDDKRVNDVDKRPRATSSTRDLKVLLEKKIQEEKRRRKQARAQLEVESKELPVDSKSDKQDLDLEGSLVDEDEHHATMMSMIPTLTTHREMKMRT
jgi:hypothetical protein